MNSRVATSPVSGLACTDREARFAEYVCCHRSRLTAVAYRILWDAGDAEDAVQDALQSAWRALPTFDERSQLATWLHRIVVNAALMQVRSRRRRRSVSVAAHFGKESPDWTPEADTPSPRAICETADEVSCVIAALANLPDDARRVVQLRLLDQLDTRQTARLLRLSPGSVKVRLFRAIRMIRDHIRLGQPANAA